MLKTVIIEDEAHALQRMITLINDHPAYELIATFSNPLEALDMIPTLDVDVMLIDVEMPEMSGMVLAEKLKRDHLQVVFVTAHSDYALDAFRVAASDYLMKPVSCGRLDKLTDRLLKVKALFMLQAEQPARPVQHAQATSRCIVQCFHTYKVINANGRIVSWPTRKTEELFAYFIVHKNGIVNKWVIAECLWPDHEVDKVLHNVHNTIYRLRETCKLYELPFKIETVNGGYIMQETGKVEVDLYAFWDGAHVTSGEGLKAIQELYKGPLFNDRDYLWSIGLREKLEMHV